MNGIGVAEAVWTFQGGAWYQRVSSMRSPLLRHGLSFLRTARVLGMREAFVEKVRYLGRRSGLAGPEETAALRAEIAAARAAAESRAEAIAIAERRAETERALRAARDQLARQGDSLRWLAQNHATPPVAPTSGSRPLVSVVLPVWNRRQQVLEAIESVLAQSYDHWELLVVDDGSTDGTRDVIRGLLADPRIRLVLQEHRGAAAARNHALAESRGEIVAYLDSDDVWYPTFLAAAVQALEEQPSRDAVYAALLVSHPDPAETFLRGAPFDRESLLEGNFIPMTAFAHRRRLCERYGGFDEAMTRLIDWDLILRYTAESKPLQIPVVAGEYRFGPWPRISNEESLEFNTWKIRRKYARLPAAQPRVLYALEYAPTLSESYIQAEIACMRRWGVEIELWAEHDPPAPCATGVPLHRGTLARVIAKMRPDVVHAHHLHRALRYLPEVATAGLRMTVRGHGVEFDPGRLHELLSSTNVDAVYVFPHQAEVLVRADGKLRTMSVAFDPDRYFPSQQKDPRLVVRASLAAPAKGLATFLHLANRHRSHRFVLFACWSIGYPHHLEELRELNRSLGDPVDLRVDRPYEEVEAVVREAAIYLHTPTLAEPYGMPISIAEAMATGCFVIARRCPGSATYLGEAGALYDADDEASAILEETVAWSDERWRRARLASIDRAFDRFASDGVLRPLLEDWARLARIRTYSGPVSATG